MELLLQQLHALAEGVPAPPAREQRLGCWQQGFKLPALVGALVGAGAGRQPVAG